MFCCWGWLMPLCCWPAWLDCWAVDWFCWGCWPVGWLCCCPVFWPWLLKSPVVFEVVVVGWSMKINNHLLWFDGCVFWALVWAPRGFDWLAVLLKRFLAGWVVDVVDLFPNGLVVYVAGWLVFCAGCWLVPVWTFAAVLFVTVLLLFPKIPPPVFEVALLFPKTPPVVALCVLPEVFVTDDACWFLLSSGVCPPDGLTVGLLLPNKLTPPCCWPDGWLTGWLAWLLFCFGWVVKLVWAVFPPNGLLLGGNCCGWVPTFPKPVWPVEEPYCWFTVVGLLFATGCCCPDIDVCWLLDNELAEVFWVFCPKIPVPVGGLFYGALLPKIAVVGVDCCWVLLPKIPFWAGGLFVDCCCLVPKRPPVGFDEELVAAKGLTLLYCPWGGFGFGAKIALLGWLVGLLEGWLVFAKILFPGLELLVAKRLVLGPVGFGLLKGLDMNSDRVNDLVCLYNVWNGQIYISRFLFYTYE